MMENYARLCDSEAVSPYIVSHGNGVDCVWAEDFVVHDGHLEFRGCGRTLVMYAPGVWASMCSTSDERVRKILKDLVSFLNPPDWVFEVAVNEENEK